MGPEDTVEDSGAAPHRSWWRHPQSPFGLLPLQLLCGISSSNVLGGDVTPMNTPHLRLAASLVNLLFLSTLHGPPLWKHHFARVCSLLNGKEEINQGTGQTRETSESP